MICPRCGKPDGDHAFAEMLHCLYADAGLSREQAEELVDQLLSEADA